MTQAILASDSLEEALRSGRTATKGDLVNIQLSVSVLITIYKNNDKTLLGMDAEEQWDARTHETTLQAMEKLDSLPQESSPRAWSSLGVEELLLWLLGKWGAMCDLADSR